MTAVLHTAAGQPVTPPDFPILQTLEAQREPHSRPRRLPGSHLQAGEVAVIAGSDLVVSSTPDTTASRTAWPVHAFDSDANPLGCLGQLAGPPDGAALALFVDLARRLFPLHAEWTAHD